MHQDGGLPVALPTVLFVEAAVQTVLRLQQPVDQLHGRRAAVHGDRRFPAQGDDDGVRQAEQADRVHCGGGGRGRPARRADHVRGEQNGSGRRRARPARVSGARHPGRHVRHGQRVPVERQLHHDPVDHVPVADQTGRALQQGHQVLHATDLREGRRPQADPDRQPVLHLSG